VRSSVNPALPVADTSAVKEVSLAFRAFRDRCRWCVLIEIDAEYCAQLGVPNSLLYNYLRASVVHDRFPFLGLNFKNLSLLCVNSSSCVSGHFCAKFRYAIIHNLEFIRSNASADRNSPAENCFVLAR
jgi:hypothetical protein